MRFVFAFVFLSRLEYGNLDGFFSDPARKNEIFTDQMNELHVIRANVLDMIIFYS